MSGFKLVCCNCGSANIVEMSGRKKLDWNGKRIKYGEGIERKCLGCSNESFEIFKTYLQTGAQK